MAHLNYFTRHTCPIIAFLSILSLTSCGKRQVVQEETAQESTSEEVRQGKNQDSLIADMATNFQSHAEFIEAYQDSVMKQAERVEGEIEELLRKIPTAKKMLTKEYELAAAYKDALFEVACCYDRGSGSPVFVADVMGESNVLLAQTTGNMLLASKNKPTQFCETTFDKRLVNEAFEVHRTTMAKVDCYDYFKSEYTIKDFLRYSREQEKCWNAWIDYRESVVDKLPTKYQKVYAGCTNLLIREMLRQTKNQYGALGETSDDLLEISLPACCTDQELLKYPGFLTMWKITYGQ